jgi:DNA polymerase III sliding clamp (beta) subunit (PCNA family)
MINRKRLLQRLKLAEPALSEYGLVPVMQHFWFTGDRVIAYDDRIAISTSLKTEFRGAVPGKHLIALLTMLRVRWFELLAENDQASIRFGDTHLIMPLLPPDEFESVFHMPRMAKENAIRGLAGPFLAAVEDCLSSVSKHTVKPDQLGVTLIPRDGELLLFSTNGAALSHVRLPVNSTNGFNRRVILSANFCRAMLRLAREAQATGMALGDGYALFTADDTQLFSRLIESNRPVDFEDIMKRFTPRRVHKQLVNIPHAELGPVFARAALTDIQGRDVQTRITIRNGEATFHSRSDRGEMFDVIELPGQPDAELEISTRLLQKDYAAFDKVLFTSKCVIFAKPGMIHLVGVETDAQ